MMRSGLLSGLVAALIAALTANGANAQCGPGAIGPSRDVPLDARGGPKLGNFAYPGTEVLKPGEVVLTFDDGPHKQLTPVILKTLAQHCVHATFFMLGQRAMMYPELAREVLREGHTVGTHTWSHQNLKKLSAEAQLNEVELGISGVQKALGQPAAPFFRFPYLNETNNVIGHLKQRNTAMISIDNDSVDYRTRSPTVVIRRVMNELKRNGKGIILFHDIQPSTAGALGALLSDMKAQGFKVVHFVPRAGQTTLASYDQRVGTPSTTGGAGAPITQRAAVAPAWEPRVIPKREIGPNGQPRVATVHVGSQPQPQPAAQAKELEQAPRPQPAPVERPVRQRDGDDWKATVFRGY
ncbi:MAG: polysaccharide deacetylase family protein [Proteobacteria bacterium]|nr:polysaccharide deacetylase family protein [Pseudomonadota bacterium]